MMDMVLQLLDNAGIKDATMPEPKTDLNLETLAVDGAVPMVWQCVGTKDDITYDVEIWLFDHGKKGVSKFIKKTPRFGSEEERRANRENINRALWMMYQDKLRAAAAV